MNFQTTNSGTSTVPMLPCESALPEPKQEHPGLRLPPRGTLGPIAIGELLHPLRQIASSPERNRLLADFFKE